MPKRSIPKGGTRGTVDKAAARERILDAEVLHEAERIHGAIYLAGYAIECHLKYAVCEHLFSWHGNLRHSNAYCKCA